MRLFLLLCIAFSAIARAQEEENWIRRVSVFLPQAESISESLAERGWIAVRKELIDDERFLVASKSFLQEKEVYQARAELKPADALLLGRLLDAQALLTFEYSDYEMKMHFYSGSNGLGLWTSQKKLNPSVPAEEQFITTAIQLTQELLADVPFQAFTVKNEISDRVVYQDEGFDLVKVFKGKQEIEIGEPALIFQLQRKNLDNLYLKGANKQVFAEGKVLSVNDDIAVVRILAKNEDRKIQVHDLVSFPEQEKRLKEQLSWRNQKFEGLLMSETRIKKEDVSDSKSFTTAIISIVNLALLILLGI